MKTLSFEVTRKSSIEEVVELLEPEPGFDFLGAELMRRGLNPREVGLQSAINYFEHIEEVRKMDAGEEII